MSSSEYIPILGGIFKAMGAESEAGDKAFALEDEANIQIQNARLARKTALINSEQQSIQGMKAIGSIESNLGASGIDSHSGSALESLRESHINAELDRQNILYGGDMRAFEATSRANAARIGASRARNTGDMNAFNALFQGATTAALLA